LVDGNLYFQRHVTHSPQLLLKFSECAACLGAMGCDFAVCCDDAGQEAAQVAELVNGFQGTITAGCNTI